MIQRCCNPNNPGYADYGARGIVVHGPWVKSFIEFYNYIGDRPPDLTVNGFPEYSLDRIDNDGNYEPGNVRWATRLEQMLNSRNPILGQLS